MRRAHDVSFQAFARRIGDDGLNPGHYAILSLIADNPGLNQTALSQATGRDKSTLTPAIRALEHDGLIVRQRSQSDRRAYHLHLTPTGGAYLDQLAAHADAVDRLLDDVVGEYHKPLLIHLLERIVDELGRDNEMAEPVTPGSLAA
ncbi:MarR family transcriptional regulator [Sphingomonas changnyeongensis]|uniref:MarR family transcriptional regulator n=1 Tax=Sphingomonas changnyeongensis TaxID=2698679 RepID=A0A7Z2NWL4_9SPHN|nr:MarR family transcriptional regulator [Sphingomonas changnyeongensis]QHL91087.1 MarR family transcriptional regulator [Sphingomonas changnyeongensis]